MNTNFFSTVYKSFIMNKIAICSPNKKSAKRITNARKFHFYKISVDFCEIY